MRVGIVQAELEGSVPALPFESPLLINADRVPSNPTFHMELDLDGDVYPRTPFPSTHNCDDHMGYSSSGLNHMPDVFTDPSLRVTTTSPRAHLPEQPSAPYALGLAEPFRSPSQTTYASSDIKFSQEYLAALGIFAESRTLSLPSVRGSVPQMIQVQARRSIFDTTRVSRDVDSFINIPS